MITVSYMDLYDETQAEGGADSCKYLLKDIQASVNFTAMTIRGHAGFGISYDRIKVRDRHRREVVI